MAHLNNGGNAIQLRVWNIPKLVDVAVRKYCQCRIWPEHGEGRVLELCDCKKDGCQIGTVPAEVFPATLGNGAVVRQYIERGHPTLRYPSSTTAHACVTDRYLVTISGSSTDRAPATGMPGSFLPRFEMKGPYEKSNTSTRVVQKYIGCKWLAANEAGL